MIPIVVTEENHLWGGTSKMIMVTGASGQLASLTLHELTERHAPVIGGSRTPSGEQRRLDFDDPGTLDLTGVSTLVMVSAGRGEDDHVITHHRAVLDAAVRDRVSHVIYTSMTGAGDHLVHAVSHRATERLVMASGLDWTILRNGVYAELFGAFLTWDGEGLVSAFGDGAVAAVARTDLAAATATIALDSQAHAGKAYELVGEPITAPQVAAHLGVAHRTITLAEFRTALAGRPLLPVQQTMAISIASNIRHGFLANTAPDLAQILRRPPTDPLTIAIRSVAAAHK